ncbi:unnamed protein product [Blepharisma stoltei]|uniref:Uncharacterized protein n=1 Tax=Blepharisma stoltei TaxID=1481888 RepID=A0AAU9IXI0_9CILI|nr:unnamed protein product [Blepharisma stoltei]
MHADVTNLYLFREKVMNSHFSIFHNLGSSYDPIQLVGSMCLLSKKAQVLEVSEVGALMESCTSAAILHKWG